MATEGTKFQVNYKKHDGTLINLYATDTELETGLTDLAMECNESRQQELVLSRWQQHQHQQLHQLLSI
jgi:hypothetical protein